MIMTASELRQYITTSETDQQLTDRLSAIELLIRAYTNNNFQARPFRSVAVAVSADKTLLVNTAIPYKAGDTLQITESEYQQNALVTIENISSGTITVLEDIFDESAVVITKVVYPSDVKMGVVNMVKWDMDNRSKVGIQSESISRHSVTYFNMDGDNSKSGYPAALVGFLKPYIKARIGQGVTL